MQKRETARVSSILIAAIAAIGMIAGLALGAQAQGYTTLRDPLIPSAYTTPSGEAAQQGQPPPPGDGSTPVGVTPGMSGGPSLMPWNTRVPANQVNVGSNQISLPVGNDVQTPPGVLGPELAGSVPFEPSTPGNAPGMLPGPLNFKPPPAAIVNINAGGGMPGDQAPKTRWGGQTTADFGVKRTRGSVLTDFGQLLPNMPNLANSPQYSQDGPRQATYPGQMGQVNRAPNITNAQYSQDLYGNKTAFKGSNRAIQTIAPY